MLTKYYVIYHSDFTRRHHHSGAAACDTACAKDIPHTHTAARGVAQYASARAHFSTRTCTRCCC